MITVKMMSIMIRAMKKVKNDENIYNSDKVDYNTKYEKMVTMIKN